MSHLHSLIIPYRHVADCFQLSLPETTAMHQLLGAARARILSVDATVSGFNIGVNCGADAGQTIPHCHFHLIPRRAGDVSEPAGGVRHIFPGKGYYPVDGMDVHR